MTKRSLLQPLRFKYPFAFFFIGMHLMLPLGYFYFSWGALITAIGLYMISAIGLSAGYHRGLAHRSFLASQWMMYVLVTCGALQLVGGPMSWVGMHHIHHKYSDKEYDPHSSQRGFWWVHCGWMFYATQDYYRCFAQVPVQNDAYYRFLDRWFLVPVVVLGVILWLIGGWTYVVWGIFVRIPLHWHATFSVNSVAHWFGYRNYDIGDGDCSRNNLWVTIATLGEGWHNNHHYDKSSAYYGRKWWEFDIVGRFIQLLGVLRLARRIIPSKKA